MQGIVNNGINIKDFEFYSLAVSVLNGCGMCVDSHVKQLEKHGMSPTQIQLAAKIAAVINSTAQALAIN
jgi:alkyl hydroperoxide reductase subunit D